MCKAKHKEERGKMNVYVARHMVNGWREVAMLNQAPGKLAKT